MSDGNISDVPHIITALEGSKVILEHTRSTIGVQCDPLTLVIDELQFILRPAAIILRFPDEERSNLIRAHIDILNTSKTAAATRRTESSFETNDGVKIRQQRFTFQSPNPETAVPPFLKCLIGVDCADEFEVEDCIVVTLFTNSQSVNGLRISEDENLSDALRRYVAWSVRYLRVFRLQLLKGVSAESEENGIRETNPEPTPPAGTNSVPLKEQIPDLASQSYFLKLVLEELRDQILELLESTDPDRFSGIAKDVFALQFFLLVGTLVEDGHAVRDQHLRYFPLKAEKKELESREEELKKLIAKEFPDRLPEINQIRPLDFIRDYPWETGHSLIGYTFKAECARYFESWIQEPLVQESTLPDDKKFGRAITTRIMQTLRMGKEHQFNIPLFARNEIFGAIIISTREAIRDETQLLPVRCARQVGSMIDAALVMDPMVNEITRKIADAEAKVQQVRAYKHMLHSLVHHEGAHCQMLDLLIADLALESGQDRNAIWERWRPLLEYTSEDRKQLVKEFHSAPIDTTSNEANPVLLVAPTSLYFDVLFSTPFGEVESSLATLETIFGSATVIRASVCAGPNLKELGEFPGVRPQVLRRIISNLLRNSLTAARNKGLVGAKVEFELELDSAVNPGQLCLTARDNCGGIDSPGFPLGSITIQKWLGYLTDLEKQREGDTAEVRGMGFLTIARYVLATRGDFIVGNCTWPDAQRGTGITVQLPLTESPNKTP